MPAITSFTANDGETTPVTHTFTPKVIDPQGVAHFVEAGSVPLEDKRASVSINRTKDNNNLKVVYNLAWPIVQTQTVNGITSPALIRTGYVSMTLTVSPTSTMQERKNLLYTFANSILAGNLPVKLPVTSGGADMIW
jgi:hypothetical protein